eukprot:TRINITY_DN4487_c0_g1_i1.p1 TRINITY_DN4487_c0_g1~~TRINITY_DN4487_c0_g1_i1.p1  ORF type:complete len:364 (+),score=48.97 TRINITY_DN4487_c0_g1_i1:87-1178(+)
MIRRPPRSTLSSSSAASDVYKRQPHPMAMWAFGGDVLSPIEEERSDQESEASSQLIEDDSDEEPEDDRESSSTGFIYCDDESSVDSSAESSPATSPTRSLIVWADEDAAAREGKDVYAHLTARLQEFPLDGLTNPMEEDCSAADSESEADPEEGSSEEDGSGSGSPRLSALPAVEIGEITSRMVDSSTIMLSWESLPSPRPACVIGFCVYARVVSQYHRPGADSFELVGQCRTTSTVVPLHKFACAYQFKITALMVRSRRTEASEEDSQPEESAPSPVHTITVETNCFPARPPRHRTRGTHLETPPDKLRSTNFPSFHAPASSYSRTLASVRFETEPAPQIIQLSPSIAPTAPPVSSLSLIHI